MSDTVKVSFWIRTNIAGSDCSDEIEFSKEQWDSMTEQQKEEELKEAAFSYVDWGYEVQP